MLEVNNIFGIELYGTGILEEMVSIKDQTAHILPDEEVKIC